MREEGNGDAETVASTKMVTLSRKIKLVPKESKSSLFKIKNIIELRKIKNFKTKKIKRRLFLTYSSLLYPLFKHHKQQVKHPKNCNIRFQPQFNRKYELSQINQILDSSSSSSFKLAFSGTPLVQEIKNALQLSTVISTSCFKMPLTIVLFLSMLITSHIANCHTVNNNYNYTNRTNNNNNHNTHDSNNNISNKSNEKSDNSYLFISYNNTHYLNMYNESLIEDSNSEVINNKTVKNLIESISSNQIIDYKLWPPNNNTKSHQPNISTEYVNIGSKSKSKSIYYKLKTFYENNNNNNQSVFEKNNFSNQTLNYSHIDDNNEQLIKIVMDGLKLSKLPDINKANISQLEYYTKYNEYLERIRKRGNPNYSIFNELENSEDSNALLSILSIRHNSSETKLYREKRSLKAGKNKNKTSSKKSILLRFPLEISSDIKASDIEEANIRLLLITSPALAPSNKFKRRHNRQNRGHKKKNFSEIIQNNNSTTEINKKQKKLQKTHSTTGSNEESSHFLNMKVFQLLEPKGRIWIDGRKIEIKFDRDKMDESTTQWLQFDVTKAVEEWLINKKQNLGLEIQCDNCFRNGARIIDDISGDSEEDDESSTLDKYDLAPVLNIIGRLGTHREKRSKHYHNQMTEKPKKKNHKNDCYKDNQRCCRHSMEVVFKEIKGFEFIIQPKVFDAGFCRGRCPPRYNPAHHHALLQSLIWKQDRKKAPRPCCAPSKLIELEVLHVDEKDNEKLKISTWTDMRVLECACS